MKPNRHHLSLGAAALLLIGMLLSACNGSAPTATTEPTAAAVPTDAPNGEGYPAPEGYQPPYPVEDTWIEIFEQNLTPNAPPPEVSAATGALQVVLRYSDSERPVRGQQMFATGTLPVSEIEGGFVPALDPNNDSFGFTDSHGLLVISDIPPGQYALSLITPLGAILIEEFDTREAVLFEIVAGEVTDLGEITVLLNADALEPPEN